jgi:hypothetical protein
MFALRFAGLLALAVWFGGLLVLGTVAAPAIFDVVDARQLADGRAFAGALFGEVLRRFHLVSYGCGAVLLVTFIARAVLGPRPRHFGIRLGIVAVMLGAASYSGIVLTGRIENLRQQMGVAPSSLPESDPRRVEFGRLHAQSTGMQVVPLLGAFILLARELAD